MATNLELDFASENSTCPLNFIFSQIVFQRSDFGLEFGLRKKKKGENKGDVGGLAEERRRCPRRRRGGAPHCHTRLRANRRPQPKHLLLPPDSYASRTCDVSSDRAVTSAETQRCTMLSPPADAPEPDTTTLST